MIDTGTDTETVPTTLAARQVAEEVRLHLFRRGISPTKLARMIGVTQPRLRRHVNGEKAFDVDLLSLISDALGVGLAELMGLRATGPANPAVVDTILEHLGDKTIPEAHRKALLPIVRASVDMWVEERRVLAEMRAAPAGKGQKVRAR